MKRRSILITFIVGIILFPLWYNVIVIRARIYYTIDYDVNLSNREEIINKIENLDYSAYFSSYYDDNYYMYGIKSYVDSDLTFLLKNRIQNDNGFKILIWPFYMHFLGYSFLAENHSKLYLTYNNFSINSVKDQYNQSLFLREDYYFLDYSWYLNFTQIPYVHGDSSTFVLSDFIFVEINLEYRWHCGYLCEHSHSFEQYLVLSENLDVVLIFTYYDIFVD